MIEDNDFYKKKDVLRVNPNIIKRYPKILIESVKLENI